MEEVTLEQLVERFLVKEPLYQSHPESLASPLPTLEGDFTFSNYATWP